MLKHWLPITSIPVAISIIWHKFKCHYLLKRRLFLDFFFFAVLKCAWHLENFEQKVEYLSLIISETIYSERADYINLWKILLQKFLLVWSVILRLFVNTLTVDNELSRFNLHNLTQIQMPLSLKQKIFSRFFIAVLKCAWNLENFE